MSDEDPTPHCGRCQFWFPTLGEKDKGTCHRFPPTPTLLAGQNRLSGSVELRNVTFWPVVTADEKCGEFSSFSWGGES
jgi:hypothetical protein